MKRSHKGHRLKSRKSVVSGADSLDSAKEEQSNQDTDEEPHDPSRSVCCSSGSLHGE